MGWRDRPYAYGESNGFTSGGGLGMGLPKPGHTVKWLLIINILVFFLQAISGDFGPFGRMSNWLGATAATWYQLWRYVTFQFLHAGIWHLALNMLALYFLGTPLEQLFGRNRFLVFYLLCGVAAGVAYVVLAGLTSNLHTPIVGASGGVYGIILAGAVYFPHFRIIFLFFPVPIRLAAIIIFAIMIFTVVSGLGPVLSGERVDPIFWSHVAHFGGAFTAGIWILSRRRGWTMKPPSPKVRRGTWERQMLQREKRQKEIDRILEKIHVSGLNSLTWKERRLLRKATQQQREEESRINRL